MLVKELAKPSAHGLHFQETVDTTALRVELELLGVVVLTVELSGVDSKETLLARLGEAFRFPEYSGQNWDAFEESVRDLSWVPAKGYVLVAMNAEGFWRKTPRLGGALVESWVFCAQEWQRESIPFHIVFRW
jgi:hypothetical protein